MEVEPDNKMSEQPITRVPKEDAIDSEDSLWIALAKPDNPIRTIRRKIKQLNKELASAEKLYNIMMNKITEAVAPEVASDSDVLEAKI